MKLLLAVGLALGLVACKQAEPAPTASSASAAAPPRTGLLAVGDPAPDITATAHNGEAVSLRGFAGKPVVVYFYP